MVQGFSAKAGGLDVDAEFLFQIGLALEILEFFRTQDVLLLLLAVSLQAGIGNRIQRGRRERFAHRSVVSLFPTKHVLGFPDIIERVRHGLADAAMLAVPLFATVTLSHALPQILQRKTEHQRLLVVHRQLRQLVVFALFDVGDRF